MTAPPWIPRPGRRTGLLPSAVALVLAAATGCSGTDSTPTAAVSTLASAPAAGSAALSAGASPGVGGGGASAPAGSPTAVPEAPSAPPATSATGGTGSTGTSAAGTAAPSGGRSGSGLPKAARPRQGKRYWAVLGAVSTDIEDAKLTAAERQFRALGYAPGRGELDCLQGAREALKVSGDNPYFEVDVLFTTESQARQVATAFTGSPLGKVAGVARITAFCLD